MFLQRTGQCVECAGQEPQLPITKGKQGNIGQQGIKGDNGWSDITAIVNANSSIEDVSGSRRIEKFISWTGGSGTIPTTPTAPNIYKGVSGWTTAALASDLRGPSGIGTIPDTGWQNMNFGIGYPHITISGATIPQWRVYGNIIYFRGLLIIASTTIGSDRSDDSVTPDPTYCTTLGQNGGAEALQFVTPTQIPMGTIVGGVSLPSTFPENITLVLTYFSRRIVTNIVGEYYPLIGQANMVMRTDGSFAISTIQDGEIIGSNLSALRVDQRRPSIANVKAGEYVMELPNGAFSNTSNTAKTLTLTPVASGAKYTYTCDTSNANHLGGFIINFRNSFGFIS